MALLLWKRWKKYCNNNNRKHKLQQQQRRTDSNIYIKCNSIWFVELRRKINCRIQSLSLLFLLRSQPRSFIKLCKRTSKFIRTVSDFTIMNSFPVNPRKYFPSHWFCKTFRELSVIGHGHLILNVAPFNVGQIEIYSCSATGGPRLESNDVTSLSSLQNFEYSNVPSNDSWNIYSATD